MDAFVKMTIVHGSRTLIRCSSADSRLCGLIQSSRGSQWQKPSSTTMFARREAGADLTTSFISTRARVQAYMATIFRRNSASTLVLFPIGAETTRNA